jgi:phosphoserine phosphatase
MDSTLINIECVDEIADAVGRKEEVAAITEAAMRGEIADYKESLRRRVALLKGVTVADMELVYTERLQLNPGAEKLVQACKAAGMKVLLVSAASPSSPTACATAGHRLHALQRAGDPSPAPTAASSPAAWSTSPGATSATAPRNARCCWRPARNLGINPLQAIAMGDGANDLPMMGEAMACRWPTTPSRRCASRPWWPINLGLQPRRARLHPGGLDRLLECWSPWPSTWPP